MLTLKTDVYATHRYQGRDIESGVLPAGTEVMRIDRSTWDGSKEIRTGFLARRAEGGGWYFHWTRDPVETVASPSS